MIICQEKLKNSIYIMSVAETSLLGNLFLFVTVCHGNTDDYSWLPDVSRIRWPLSTTATATGDEYTSSSQNVSNETSTINVTANPPASSPFSTSADHKRPHESDTKTIYMNIKQQTNGTINHYFNFNLSNSSHAHFSNKSSPDEKNTVSNSGSTIGTTSIFFASTTAETTQMNNSESRKTLLATNASEQTSETIPKSHMTDTTTDTISLHLSQSTTGKTSNNNAPQTSSGPDDSGSFGSLAEFIKDMVSGIKGPIGITNKFIYNNHSPTDIKSIFSKRKEKGN
ncbi:uncharacterized protein LOC142349405 isoform X2 [Convolutriloba macropyga]|uniref:uncharacterized protein LOC142349405 isoform X2 n=1 Tax=Convolutriloba macropyga TaxID=536237 RepID=UPI003F528A5E